MKADEELAVGRVGFIRACHRHCPAQMRQFVKLGLQIGKLRPTLARARGIAGLRHEALNHAVEDNAIVKALTGQRLDPLNMGGRNGGEHLNSNAAARRQIEHQHIFKVRRNGRRRSWRRLRECGGTREEQPA